MARIALSPAVRVVIAAALVVAVSMGLRQAFGVFLRPVTLDLELGREVFGLAIALQNLVWGLSQPLLGALADRFGPQRVVALGAGVYAAGLGLAAATPDPLTLNLTVGLLAGLGLAGTGYVVTLGAVARAVPAHRRSLAMGVTTAAGSFGMFAMVPAAQGLIAGLGWQLAWVALALAAVTMAIAAQHLRADERPGVRAPVAEGAASLRLALGEAGRHRGFWLLTAGFFVCGFHVAFIATHLPAYLADELLPDGIAAGALALIGLVNIAGTYAFGALGDHLRRKHLLAVLYLLRAAAIGWFLVVPVTPTTALAFGAVIGFLWLGTVPLTSALVGQIFGVRYLGSLFGLVFLGHQLGSFLGAWSAGLAYDATGGYEAVWIVSAVLALLAAALHWGIDDRTVRRAPRGEPEPVPRPL